MWLIDVETYKLEFFHDEHDVRYAILSHRWEGQEVSYNDILRGFGHSLDGATVKWNKIAQCCKQAQKDKLQYVWVDTCCIDKSSSAELQEAINSMFRWYKQAEVCYAFLSDVDSSSQDENPLGRSYAYGHFERSFRTSEWFRRGWTLQELIAPQNIIFFDSNWLSFGSRYQLAEIIHEITGVDTLTIRYGYQDRPCVANVMSWAANRKTTRLEDRAYSLLGLFGISMPLLYGEGDMAFIRLQEEILRRSDDQSIFAWSGFYSSAGLYTNTGLLATSPDQFSAPPKNLVYLSPTTFPRRAAHSVTNEGISLQLLLSPVKPRVYLAILNPVIKEVSSMLEDSSINDHQSFALIYLKRIDASRYVRWGDEVSLESLTLDFVPSAALPLSQYLSVRQVVVVDSVKQGELKDLELDRRLALNINATMTPKDDCGIAISLPDTPAMGIALDVADIREGIAYFVELRPYGQENNVPYIKVETIIFQFDFDLNPVCMLSVDWPDQGQNIAASRVAFQSSEYSLDPFPNSTELGIYINGGEWRNESRDVVGIRSTMENLFSGEGFSVRIWSHQSGRPDGVIDIQIFEDIPAGSWVATVTTSVQ